MLVLLVEHLEYLCLDLLGVVALEWSVIFRLFFPANGVGHVVFIHDEGCIRQLIFLCLFLVLSQT